MINVRFTSDDDYISYLEIKGHADSNKKGKDLVCSAVSGIVIGSINSLTKIAKKDIKVIDGEVIIKPSKKITYDDNIRIKMMITQLKILANSYPSYIKIKKEKKV